MIDLFIFIFSICVGSFLNVLIYRLPKREDVVMKRSYCPICKHKLGVFDLIPILSYLCLKGKCRYCKSKISFLYPFIELLSGCIGLYCFYHYGFSLNMFLTFILLETLIVISFIDIKIMIIYDECNFILFLLALIYIFMNQFNLYEHIFYACLIVLMIWIINRIQLSFGGGDMKLFFSLGLYFGNRIFLIFILSIFLGCIYGVYLLLIRKVHRKTYFPFAPFISLACFICIFYGTSIVEWYRFNM